MGVNYFSTNQFEMFKTYFPFSDTENTLSRCCAQRDVVSVDILIFRRIDFWHG